MKAAIFFAAALLTSCVAGRLDSDHFRAISLGEVRRMDVTPWHPQPETLNEVINRVNRRNK